jgi:hypothetical protein
LLAVRFNKQDKGKGEERALPSSPALPADGGESCSTLPQSLSLCASTLKSANVTISGSSDAINPSWLEGRDMPSIRSDSSEYRSGGWRDHAAASPPQSSAGRIRRRATLADSP